MRFGPVSKKIAIFFSEKGAGGGGQRPFGNFPEIHRYWKRRASLTQLCEAISRADQWPVCESVASVLLLIHSASSSVTTSNIGANCDQQYWWNFLTEILVQIVTSNIGENFDQKYWWKLWPAKLALTISEKCKHIWFGLAVFSMLSKVNNHYFVAHLQIFVYGYICTHFCKKRSFGQRVLIVICTHWSVCADCYVIEPRIKL